tara:strand:- start:98 stop:937 length:840 start_codon:yes stop_codon:yes gene_type:complete
MISKFEEEFEIKVFNRKKKPVELTKEGEILIDQLKLIQKELAQLKEISNEIKGNIKGELSIAVIPTIAPFLLPHFLQSFASRFPELKIKVREQTTEEIVRQIKSRELDIGILSLPINDNDLVEHALYNEPFVYYDASNQNTEHQKASIKQLNLNNLCLLEEGHCMRTQIMELCDLHKKTVNNKLNFEYKAGSIDSLLRFVNANKASTLLPHLSAIDLTKKEQNFVSTFEKPIPFRSVGIVVHQHFVKFNVLNNLKSKILQSVIPLLPEQNFKGEQLSPV